MRGTWAIRFGDVLLGILLLWVPGCGQPGPSCVVDPAGQCQPVRGVASSPDLPEANSAVELWLSDSVTSIAIGTDFACETMYGPEDAIYAYLNRAARSMDVPHTLGDAAFLTAELDTETEDYPATAGTMTFSILATAPGETTTGELQISANGQSISALFEAYLCP